MGRYSHGQVFTWTGLHHQGASFDVEVVTQHTDISIGARDHTEIVPEQR